MTGSVDTNVILRRLIGDAPEHHDRARRLFESDQLRVSDVAIIEASFALGRHYGFDRQRQTTLLLGLLASPGIDGDLALFSAAFAEYLEHPALSLEDCYLVALSNRDERGPLWTFDRSLATQLVGAQLVP
jgi:predicted nucleic acid-binding protein